jgi:membrane-bound serine protease (ClpP class)
VGTILLLAGAGFLLLLTEMLLPGGVLGALGGLLLVAAVIVGYGQWGALWGSGLLAAIAVSVLVGFCLWMAVFPRTAMGKKMTLRPNPSLGDTQGFSSPPVGSEGVALTILRPAGKALIMDRRVDVVAEGDFIESGEPVIVILGEGARVVVRKKA